ncbi:MAG: pseudouridine synthase [Bacteroidia bacterium]|nr:pseudouridine synthase [Bacteroidia bacterium]
MYHKPKDESTQENPDKTGAGEKRPARRKPLDPLAGPDAKQARPRIKRKPFENRSQDSRGDAKPRFERDNTRKPFENRAQDSRGEAKPRFERDNTRKPFENRSQDSRGEARPRFERDNTRKPFENRNQGDWGSQRPFFERDDTPASFDKYEKEDTNLPFKREKPTSGAKGRRNPEIPAPPDPTQPVRLNRFIGQAGVCSRRDADKLISNGEITVNGAVVTELGLKIVPQRDVVAYKGKVLTAQTLVYILLNKPRNMITTTDDPRGRKIVLDTIERVTQQRVFPVGRLDRNTTGLLLLTNDGELTERLTHPSYQIRKVYYVRLDKPFAEADMQQLVTGVQLEDGLAQVDKIDYVEGKDASEVGVEIHSGRNRIVRRMFEHLGYEVIGLDRVLLGFLTKKNLPRGTWRLLSDREVSFLKMM